MIVFMAFISIHKRLEGQSAAIRDKSQQMAERASATGRPQRNLIRKIPPPNDKRYAELPLEEKTGDGVNTQVLDGW